MKKSWIKPEVVIMRKHPLQAKNIHSVREGTYHLVFLSSLPYKGAVNAAGSHAVSITSGGVTKHHLSELGS